MERTRVQPPEDRSDGSLARGELARSRLQMALLRYRRILTRASRWSSALVGTRHRTPHRK